MKLLVLNNWALVFLDAAITDIDMNYILQQILCSGYATLLINFLLGPKAYLQPSP